MTGASLRDRASRAVHGALAGLRHSATIPCAYAAATVLTYGHAGAEGQRWVTKHCHTPQERLAEPTGRCFKAYEIAALAEGVAWPLYWSWELQQ